MVPTVWPIETANRAELLNLVRLSRAEHLGTENLGTNLSWFDWFLVGWFRRDKISSPRAELQRVGLLICGTGFKGQNGTV